MRVNTYLHYDYKSFFKSYTILPKNTNIKTYKINYSNIFKVKTSYLLLNNKVLVNLPLKKNTSHYYNTQKTLSFNFKRNRFFPTIRTLSGENYTFLSLGMLSKFFQKNKAFLKTKTMYLLLVSFLRKVLLFSSFKYLILTIIKTPLYLKEMLTTLNNPVTKVYQNPFNDVEINEKTLLNPFKFSFIMFLNNKPFTPLKLKKKGRLKRKISKRITLLNKIID